jgi:hypothetical protein
MERLNLNIPTEARKTLKRFAREANLREAEFARKLLLKQLKLRERAEFYKKVAAAQTPEHRKRMLEIARAMEKLRG